MGWHIASAEGVSEESWQCFQRKMCNVIFWSAGFNTSNVKYANARSHEWFFFARKPNEHSNRERRRRERKKFGMLLKKNAELDIRVALSIRENDKYAKRARWRMLGFWSRPTKRTHMSRAPKARAKKIWHVLKKTCLVLTWIALSIRENVNKVRQTR